MEQQLAKAHVKMQRISARKARLVADLVRYKDVKTALGLLHNTNKKASQIIIKLLNSAIANATNNHGMDASKLFVKEILVNEGPTLKRYQPHSQGRAYSIFKRTSHFSITLAENEIPKLSKKIKKISTKQTITKEIKEKKQATKKIESKKSTTKKITKKEDK